MATAGRRPARTSSAVTPFPAIQLLPPTGSALHPASIKEGVRGKGSSAGPSPAPPRKPDPPSEGSGALSQRGGRGGAGICPHTGRAGGQGHRPWEPSAPFHQRKHAQTGGQVRTHLTSHREVEKPRPPTVRTLTGRCPNWGLSTPPPAPGRPCRTSQAPGAAARSPRCPQPCTPRPPHARGPAPGRMGP